MAEEEETKGLVEEEEEEEETVDLAPNVPQVHDEQLNRRATIQERFTQALGVAPVTKDPEYKEVLGELEEFEKGIKTFKTALGLYVEKFKAVVDAEATVRVLAGQSFGASIGAKLEPWSEARSVAEASKTTEALSAIMKLKGSVDKYEKELRLTREATNKATMKARRDFEHYEAKVSNLTQSVLNAENDLAKRAVRDKRAREEAEAKHQPPPEKTHYWYEDSNEVAAAKLEKLKDKLKRNEDKLEVARIWNERTHTFGKLSFKTLVDGCEADCAEIVQELIEVDKLLCETSAKALPTYQAVVSDIDNDAAKMPPLNERLASAKEQAGYNKSDVAAPETLDHDDDDDDGMNPIGGLCGFGH
mmetsp:Transcript_21505/g.67458  ORF Transcript_21505/g.67458 Transcript_21505/m.67458 type:complete len:360 (+) Transcript_21505:111-1190(+)